MRQASEWVPGLILRGIAFFRRASQPGCPLGPWRLTHQGLKFDDLISDFMLSRGQSEILFCDLQRLSRRVINIECISVFIYSLCDGIMTLYPRWSVAMASYLRLSTRKKKRVPRRFCEELYASQTVKFGRVPCFVCLEDVSFADASFEYIKPLFYDGDSDKRLSISHANCKEMRGSMKEGSGAFLALREAIASGAGYMVPRLTSCANIH